jgi:uncharacterized coiled-coil protein SlyX
LTSTIEELKATLKSADVKLSSESEKLAIMAKQLNDMKESFTNDLEAKEAELKEMIALIN